MVDNQVPEVIQPVQSSTPALLQEMSIEQVVARVEKVRELQKRVMKENVHYGTIPGTPKPTLYKAGAELMLLTFMLDPQYEHTVQQDGKHREILSRCILYHIPTNNRVGSGQGSCSTYESKYAYRKATPKCPRCQKDLRRSKTEWYCWRKQGGCGSTYPIAQFKDEGRIENTDIADQYNTVLKMSNKRALIAGILNVTAASEIFTQDLEDFQDDKDLGEARREERADTASGSGTSAGISDIKAAMAAAASADIKHGEARARNVTRSGQPEFVSSDDALSQAPASPRIDEVAAEERPGVVEGQEGASPDAPAEPADKNGIERISKLFNATVRRLKDAGNSNAYSDALATVQKLSPSGIPGLRQNQLEKCAEQLQSL